MNDSYHKDDEVTLTLTVGEVQSILALLGQGDDAERELGDNVASQLNTELYGDHDEHDQFRTDAEADADALASAGMGTDEDYGGCHGGDDDY
jgi:hypothetical protein